MAVFLFRIADAFEIKNRGLVLAADITESEIPATVCMGDEIEFRAPNGRRFLSRIRARDFSAPANPDRPFTFLAEEGLTKPDVPIGTEVWRNEPA